MASGPAAQYRYPRPGNYLVTLTATTVNGPLQTRINFYVSERSGLRISLGDTLVCEDGVPLRASAQSSGTIYRWQDGSTASGLHARTAGLY